MRPEDLVPRRGPAQLTQELVLGQTRWKVERLREADARRHGLVDQRVQRRGAGRLEHRVAFRVVWADVAGLKALELEVHQLFHQVAVLRGIEQRAGFARVGQLHDDHPARVGSAFTPSGFSLRAVFTSTTSPVTGEYSSDTAFTDSIVPNDCPCLSLAPTSGSST